MDTALLVASASLSVYIPAAGCGGGGSSSFRNRSEMTSRCIAIALCLGLFSLTVLEAVPDSLLTWLSTTDHDTSSSVWSIAQAYWALLWCLVVLIIGILPSLVGISFANTISTSIRYYSGGSDGNFYFGLDRCCPWWVKLVLHVFKSILRSIIRSGRLVCVSRRVRRSISKELLPITRTKSSDSSGSMMSIDMSDDLPLLGSSASHTAKSVAIGSTLIGSLCGILVTVLILRTLGPFVVQTTSDDHSTLSLIVSWLVGWGLLLSSILNGFGSVSMPHASLTGLYLKPVPPEVIENLQAERESVKQTLETRRQSLKEAKAILSPPTSTRVHRPTTVFSSKTTAFSAMGNELSNRRAILQSEIGFLENLCHEMGEDIEELKHTQIKAGAARTTTGKLRFYLGVLFSVILLIRLFSAAINIWRSHSTMNADRQKHPQSDVVTSILGMLLGNNLVSFEKYNMLSQVISLALTAFLSFTQVRTFVKTMNVVNRKVNGFWIGFVCARKQPQALVETNNRSLGADAGGGGGNGGIMGYLAILTGCCYTLACIVSIKSMLPDKYCIGFAKALGGSMDVFTIHTAVVNEVFALSAILSASILGILFGIQRDNNFRHTSTTTVINTSTAANKYRGAESC